MITRLIINTTDDYAVTNMNTNDDANWWFCYIDPLSDGCGLSVIAYPATSYISSEYPGIQATIENIDVPAWLMPMTVCLCKGCNTDQRILYSSGHCTEQSDC